MVGRADQLSEVDSASRKRLGQYQATVSPFRHSLPLLFGRATSASVLMRRPPHTHGVRLERSFSEV